MEGRQVTDIVALKDALRALSKRMPVPKEEPDHAMVGLISRTKRTNGKRKGQRRGAK